jgi:Spy/CpxP family protein refolding chaperone
MKKRWFTIVMALMMVLGLSGVTVLAQPAAAPEPGEERGMTQERREELRNKIEHIWQQKLTERLDLTEAEQAKLFPLLRQYEEQKRVLRQENRHLVRELEGKIKANASEKELKRTIKALEENERKLQEMKEEGFHELAQILPVEKQARYIVFQEQFRREIHRLIQKARHRERGPRTGPPEEGPERP